MEEIETILSKMPEQCVEMYKLISSYVPTGIDSVHILDVGSMDYGDNCVGFFKLFKREPWRYVGIDLVRGLNVNVVTEPYRYPFHDGAFDMVIANQVLEHVEKPWLWIKEISRVCREGGSVVISTVWKFKRHKRPKDYWRVLPDGMCVLFAEMEMSNVRTFVSDTWCYGGGVKRCQNDT